MGAIPDRPVVGQQVHGIDLVDSSIDGRLHCVHLTCGAVDCLAAVASVRKMYKKSGPAFGPPAEVLMNQTESEAVKEGKTRRFSLPMKWTRQLMQPKASKNNSGRSSSDSLDRSMTPPVMGASCNSQLLEDATCPGAESPPSSGVYQRRHLNAPQILLGSQEELDTQFAGFDQYLTGLEEVVNRDIPPTELPSLHQIRRQAENEDRFQYPPVHLPSIRQRSKSETQRPHPAGLQLAARPRPLLRRKAQSILPAPGNFFPGSPSGSTQDLANVSRGKTSLELLPEDIPVHHLTPVRSVSPATPLVADLSQPSDRLSQADSGQDTTAAVPAISDGVKQGRSRSWTSSATVGLANRFRLRSNAADDGPRRDRNEDEPAPRGRQRSWTISVQRPAMFKAARDAPSATDDSAANKKKRRRLGSVLLPIFNRLR